MIQTTISLTGVRWDYLSEGGQAWQAELPADELEGELVKATPKRRVLHLPEVYVKEVAYRGLASILKTVAGGTACREGRISLELAKRGVPAPQILAFGAERHFGLLSRDLLLTGAVEGGLPLFDLLTKRYPALPVRSKIRLAEGLASFVSNLHEKGVLHTDLHVGNILIVLADEAWRFVLLDTDRVRLKNRPLTREERVRNLGQLLSNLWTLSSRAQRFRFLRSYGVRLDHEGRKLVREIELRALKASFKVWNGKARRSLYSNSRFVSEQRGLFKVHRVRSEESEALLVALLPDPDLLLERGETFKAGRTVRAARIEVDGRSYFLKRYNCKSWGYRIKNAVRRSRAVRTWLVSWGFRVRDLPTPKPLLCIEERRFRLLGRSYLVSEFVGGAIRLTDLWPGLDVQSRGGVLAKLGCLLGRMHRFGCLHGDLKWNNILLRPADGDREVVLTDLDGSRVYSRLNFDKAKKDLKRFLRDLSLKGQDDRNQSLFFGCWKKWFHCKRFGRFRS